MKLVRSEKAISIEEYLKNYLDINSDFIERQALLDNIESLSVLRKWMDENEFEGYWDYPLSEIDEIVENEREVILVTDGEEYRWFETP